MALCMKTHFWEKRVFFTPNLAFLHTKWAKMGSIGGSRRLILGFWGSQTIWEPKKWCGAKIFSQNCVSLAVFETHFGHFVCKMVPNGPFWGGLEGSKIRTQWISFLNKKFLGEKTIFRPPGPPTEKIFTPSRAARGPKVGQNRSFVVSNPSQTVGHPQKWYVWHQILCRKFLSSQSYAQNMFFGLRWGFLTCFGAGWGEPKTRRLQDPQKSKGKVWPVF